MTEKRINLIPKKAPISNWDFRFGICLEQLEIRPIRLIVFLLLFLGVAFSHDAHAGTIIKSPAYLGLQTGLVGCWNFDGSYTKAQDCSGNNNTGTLTNGPTKVSGKVGQAIAFDGADDVITIANEANFDFSHTQPFTLSAWVYRDTNTAEDDIIEKVTNIFNGFGLYLESGNNNIQFTIQGSGGAISVNVVSNGSAAPLRKWFHLVATYNGTAAATGMEIYVDGVVRSENRSGTFGGTMLNNDPLLIGDDRTETSCCEFDGLIDETRIYNRALSANEIQRLYRIGLGSTANRITTALDKGLVGHWTFDAPDIGNPGGTRVKDRSGNDNHGTLTGGLNGVPIKSIGKIGQALQFDRIDDEVIVAGDPASLKITGSLTVSAWVKSGGFTGAGGNDDNMFVTKLSASTSAISWGLAATTDNGPEQFIMFVSSNGSTNVGRYSNTNPVVGRWYHVVGVYNATAQTIDVYVDGVLDSGASLGGTPPTSIFNTDAQVVIGDIDDASLTFRWNGLIDDVRIYNRVLSAAEISRLYNSTQSKFNSSKTGDILTNGLVGHWTFDGPDISGTRAKDRSGNNNHGTLTGANGLPVRKLGKVGQALSFDGVDDYVSIDNESRFDFEYTQPFTLSAWINVNTIKAGVIMEKLNDSGFEGYVLSLAADGKLDFSITEVESIQATTTGNNLAPLGQWTQVVAIYDGSQNVAGLSIYTNGVIRPDSDTGTNLNSTILNDTNLIIGDDRLHSGISDFDGRIDEVKVYNRALSAGEINKLYQMGR